MAIEGLNQFIKWTDSITTQLEEDVKKLVKETSYQIELDAKALSPVDTTRLRSSISTELSPDGLSGEVGTNVEYAAYVEYGTSKMESQPFLNPSFIKNKMIFLHDMEQLTKKAGE